MHDSALGAAPLSSSIEERGSCTSLLQGCGIGLRAQHQRRILAERPSIAWLEVHSENYFAPGGPQLASLQRIREHYPLSLHGVGLSLGSTDELDQTHLRELERLVRTTQPALISEHLSWGSVSGRFVNDLLPLPYTEEALHHTAARVRAVQDRLGRQILIENVSSYIRFAQSQLSEWEFLVSLARESGCAILLDVNNVYVSATNHGFDPERYLDAVPAEMVGEIHLAGHTVTELDGCQIRIDTHSERVCQAVWDLYAYAVGRLGAIPTLIEWDTDIPELEVLIEEASRAGEIAGRVSGLAATSWWASPVSDSAGGEGPYTAPARSFGSS
jgi:uncharacterized protein